MGFGSWLSKTFGGAGSEIIKGIGETADRFITTKEEKMEFQLELQRMDLQFKKLAMEAEAEWFKDKESARAMYMKDSSLQKVFAIVFLVFYCILSGGMIGMVVAMAFYSKEVNLPDWGVMLISSVFTAMSTKVATITDFLFGGSKKEDDSEKRMAKAFEETME